MNKYNAMEIPFFLTFPFCLRPSVPTYLIVASTTINQCKNFQISINNSSRKIDR